MGACMRGVLTILVWETGYWVQTVFGELMIPRHAGEATTALACLLRKWLFMIVALYTDVRFVVRSLFSSFWGRGGGGGWFGELLVGCV